VLAYIRAIQDAAGADGERIPFALRISELAKHGLLPLPARLRGRCQRVGVGFRRAIERPIRANCHAGARPISIVAGKIEERLEGVRTMARMRPPRSPAIRFVSPSDLYHAAAAAGQFAIPDPVE
jgi:hypothetical protein